MTLYQHNETTGYLPRLEFALLLNRYWWSACDIASRNGVSQVISAYHASPVVRLPRIQDALSQGLLASQPPQRLPAETLRGKVSPMIRRLARYAKH